LGIELSPEAIARFQAYTALLLEWNKRIHLVSRGDAKADRILRHFVDSLSIFKAIDLSPGIGVLDLGAGAGFPSIPIKIVRDDIRLTLVESIHKKTLFLKKLREVLKLEEISILNRRAEALKGEAELEGRFDLVTAKALGELRHIIELALPFLKTGGLLVAYKGRGIEGELKQAEFQRGYRMEKIEIPEMGLLRWLVVMEKSE